MAGYSVRSLTQLAIEARAYFLSAIEGAIVSVWPNSFTVVAKVLAILGQEHEQRRAWLYDQLFVSTASTESVDRHGYELGLVRRPGVAATGSALFPSSVGVTIPAGTRLVRADGVSYRSTATVGPTLGMASIPIIADEFGALGNAEAGIVIRLSPDTVVPAGFNAQGQVAIGGLTGGADAEASRAFRQRVLNRRRKPAAGGSSGDWERWAMAAPPAVTRVFIDSFTDDSRAIWLAFMVSDQPNGVPTTGQVSAVQTYVADPIRRPVTARVFVVAPTASPVDVTITGLTPDNATSRAAIAAELAVFFAESVTPGRPSGAFLLRRSAIEAAIARVVGEDAFTLTAPAGNLSFAAGVLPTLGVLAYA